MPRHQWNIEFLDNSHISELHSRAAPSVGGSTTQLVQPLGEIPEEGRTEKKKPSRVTKRNSAALETDLKPVLFFHPGHNSFPLLFEVKLWHLSQTKWQWFPTKKPKVIVQMFHLILDQFISCYIMAHYTSPIVTYYFSHAFGNSVTYNKNIRQY